MEINKSGGSSGAREPEIIGPGDAARRKIIVII
jgi:hypothetical protein